MAVLSVTVTSLVSVELMVILRSSTVEAQSNLLWMLTIFRSVYVALRTTTHNHTVIL